MIDDNSISLRILRRGQGDLLLKRTPANEVFFFIKIAGLQHRYWQHCLSHRCFPLDFAGFIITIAILGNICERQILSYCKYLKHKKLDFIIIQLTAFFLNFEVILSGQTNSDFLTTFNEVEIYKKSM